MATGSDARKPFNLAETLEGTLQGALDLLEAVWEFVKVASPTLFGSAALFVGMLYFSHWGHYSVGPIRSLNAILAAALVGMLGFVLLNAFDSSGEDYGYLGIVCLLGGLGLPATIIVATSRPTFVPLAIVALLFLVGLGGLLWRKGKHPFGMDWVDWFYFAFVFFVPAVSAFAALHWFTKML